MTGNQPTHTKREIAKKLLVLSRYTRLGASSRLRTMQFERWLERGGFEVDYAPFFDDAYLQRLYGGASNMSALVGYYRERVAQIRRRPQPDLIWIEKEVFPWLPWFLEQSLLPKGIPIVSDYDDAVFHRYDSHRLAPVRWLLGKKIDLVMRSSALVTAGNGYLSERATASGAGHVKIVPTVVDLEHYKLRGSFSTTDKLSVGWIGTPETWSSFALARYKKMQNAVEQNDAVFLAVGAALDRSFCGHLKILPWSEDKEVELIQSMAIGVMPLPDTPWTRGKCGYKLIQYMACGLPVIASPVGVNTEIVEHGVNGFLATTDAEWREALVMLLRDPDLRNRMGAAGRQKVEEQYSLQIWGPRVADMLSKVAREHIA